MNRKIRTEIIQIELNEGTYEGTYHGKTIEPTLINFFYGRNGSGKSTLARAIFEKRGLTWKDQNNNIPVMIFDENYVKETLKNYDKMLGVFTLGEDEEARAKLDEKKDELKAANSNLESLQKKLKKAQQERDGAIKASQIETWERTRIFRDYLFPDLVYPGMMKNLFRDLMQRKPVKGDVNDLQKLHKILYDDVQAQYEPYMGIDHVRFPSSQIVYKPIISRSDTNFAKFVKTLGNLDWIREGYDKYLHKSEGKCPFCQREGVDIAFIERLFDEQYEKDIEELKIFIGDYKASYKQIIDIHNANLGNPYFLNSELVQLYQQEFNTFRDKVDMNGVAGTKAFKVKITTTTVSGTIPATATLKTSYTWTLKASGGTSSYTWTISKGSLPTGMKINASTGKITGKPTKSGTFTFTVKAKDKNGVAGTKAYTVKVTSQATNKTAEQFIATELATDTAADTVNAPSLKTSIPENLQTEALTAVQGNGTIAPVVTTPVITLITLNVASDDVLEAYEGKDSDLVKVKAGQPLTFIIGEWGVDVSSITVYVDDEPIEELAAEDSKFTLPAEMIHDDFKVCVKAQSNGVELESEELYIISE